MIAAIGAQTSRIRIGSGGVMLPHYSPLKVAETFTILSALYPTGSIWASAAHRAPIRPRHTRCSAIGVSLRPTIFRSRWRSCSRYLENRMPADHPFARLAALPGRPHVPEVWLLGSSPQSAVWAAEAGLPYSFADFINPGGASYAAMYRESFQPSERLRSPKVMAAVWAICAETDEEAQRIASSARMTRALLNQGRLIPVPPIDKALKFLNENGSNADTAARPRRAIIGSPETVRQGIHAVAEAYQAEEVMIVTITYEHLARRRSYELIAEAFAMVAS